MAEVGNWIGEVTTTTGTGPVTLGGQLDGFASWDNVPDGLVWYTIKDGNNKECGMGTLASGVLTRTTVHATLFNGTFDDTTPSAISLSGLAEVYSTLTKEGYDELYAGIGVGGVTSSAVVAALDGASSIPDAIPVSGDKILFKDVSDAGNLKEMDFDDLPGAGGGEANTSSNSGAGEGLALAKSGVNLPFKSLVGGAGITLSSDATTVTIDADQQTVDVVSNVASGVILGRTTTGNGDSEELTPAATRTLLNVEDGATADQTGAEIKTAYESEANTNAYTDADAAKVGFISVTQAVDLDTIESDTATNNAKISYTDAAAVAANTAKVSAAGSVGTHSDVNIAAAIGSSAATLRVLADHNTDGTYDVIDWTPPAGGGSFALPTRNDSTTETLPVTFDTRVSITTTTPVKTLPSAPADGSFIALSLDAVTAGTGTLTLNRGGTDTIDWKGTSINSVVLRESGDRVVMYYDADNGQWRLIYDGIKGPWCRVTRSGSQSITADTADKMEWNSIVTDYGGIFDASTNFRCTPDLPGIYGIWVGARIEMDALRWVRIMSYKNASLDLNGSWTERVGDTTHTEFFEMVLNGSTDYAETFAYVQGGTGHTFNSTGLTPYLFIKRLR